MKPLTLYELNALARRTIEQSLDESYWLQAELSDVRTNATGHCYVEFVQKDVHGNTLVAKARGTIWANVYRLLRPYFERETGQSFAAGIKVLVQVKVEFHELYGYSLTVTDIDPTYTIGDMVRKRREILQRLQEEGVLTLNKELYLPILPQRIAVISSPTAAGYGDFCNQLENNPYGFVFYPILFPAIMQGEQTEDSILSALNEIYDMADELDALVIIRGGGAVSDLSGFDTYMLATSCAQFPLPIITGIGHERDDTVLDLVAHTRVKTPTAAADFLINRVRETAFHLDELAEYIYSFARMQLDTEKVRLSSIITKLPSLFTLRKIREENKLVHCQKQMLNDVNRILMTQKHALELIKKRVDGCDVQKILKRGFSLTFRDEQIISDVTQLKTGDRIVTRFYNGKVSSEVK